MSEALPSGWSKATFGDILSHRKMAGRPGDELLSVTAKNGIIRQSESGRRNISSGDKSSYNRVLPNDIVYNTMRMWQGVSGVSGFSGIVSPAYTVCVTNGLVDAEFLAYLLKHPGYVNNFRMMSQGLVSDTWNLKFSQLAQLDVVIPPSAEQRMIADVLNAVDEAIGASADCVDKLSRLREAALSELIGRGFVLAQESLGQGVSANSYVGSPGGVVEEYRWRLLRCAEVLKLAGGSPALINENREGSFAVYGGNGVIGYTDRPLVGGDVLIIGRVGQYSGAVYYSDIPVWVTDNALYSKAVYGDWDKRFLALYLKWFDLRKSQSLNDNPLVTQASISRVPVAQPPLREQKRIVSIIEAYDERIAAEKARLEKLRKLKAGLMDDLLTGRVRVNQLNELPV